jgi:hypothetical protein
MENSPIKFVGGALGAAGAAASMYGLGQVGTFSGRGQGMPGIAPEWQGRDMGAAAGGYSGVGGRDQAVIDASAQFNPAAVQAANGIFGNVNARQAAVGASGIFRNTSKYNNV